MTMDSILEEKEKILGPLQDVMKTRAIAIAEGAQALRPEERIAVGYSPSGQGFRLELFVHKEDGPAGRKASNISERLGHEARVGVIQSAEVAPIKVVREMSVYHKRLLQPHSATNPICIGASVSHIDEAAPGTLGGFVDDANGRPGILSCSHVLALSGRADAELMIVYPGCGDARAIRRTNSIATLEDFSRLSRGTANAYDAAYALLKDNIPVTGNVIPENVDAPDAEIGQAIGYTPGLPFREGMRLAKVGRTTGYTTGIFDARGVDNISVLVRNIGVVYFDNVLHVRWRAVNQPFTKGGDSGSIVFTAEDRQAVGMHFASLEVLRDGHASKVSLACELAPIFDDFNINWR